MTDQAGESIEEEGDGLEQLLSKGHLARQSEKIVGHKTFYTKERGYWHEPLTESEVAAILEAGEKRKAERAEKMPDVQSAIDVMFEAWQRLKELGWSEAIYCPKDGTAFEVIEPGSTGIHKCIYEGEWPTGSWCILEDGDMWPSHPTLFRLYPEDEAERKAKMDEARARFANEREPQ